MHCARVLTRWVLGAVVLSLFAGPPFVGAQNGTPWPFVHGPGESVTTVLNGAGYEFAVAEDGWVLSVLQNPASPTLLLYRSDGSGWTRILEQQGAPRAPSAPEPPPS